MSWNKKYFWRALQTRGFLLSECFVLVAVVVVVCYLLDVEGLH